MSSYWAAGKGVCQCCVTAFCLLCGCLLKGLYVCCVFVCTFAFECLLCIVLNMGGGFRYMVCVVFGCVMSWCFVWKWDIWHEKCVVLCFLCVSFWCAWGCGHGDMRR